MFDDFAMRDLERTLPFYYASHDVGGVQFGRAEGVWPRY